VVRLNVTFGCVRSCCHLENDCWPPYALSQGTEDYIPVIPASDASLKDENLPGEDSVPLLLQVEIVGVLQEHLGPSQLVVSLTQHRLTDPGGSRPAVNLRRYF
jgi:hypothetical protein